MIVYLLFLMVMSWIISLDSFLKYLGGKDKKFPANIRKAFARKSIFWFVMFWINMYFLIQEVSQI